MKHISATKASNNTSSSATVPGFTFPSKTEGIALCSAFAFEAVLIVVGNFLTVVLFTFNKKLRKKILFLVINMAFADVMLGTVALPLYIYLSSAVWYRLWVNEAHVSFLFIFRQIFEAIFSHTSLVSAVFMSCERCYAIYWPLKHRLLSIRAYRVVIFMVWALTILVSAVYCVLLYFISTKRAVTFWTSFPLTYLFIICACNISICRKFQKSNMASQRENRASQNQRLTKTLLFVSISAVFSWLPFVIVHYLIFIQKVFFPRWVLCFGLTRILLYSNSFVNPFVYALRIPEFRQALGWYRLRRQTEINGRDNERVKNRAAVFTPVRQLRTLSTDLSHLQLEFEKEGLDTKL